MLDYEQISERLLSVTLETKGGPLTIFQVYAPDSSYPDSDVDEFYDQIQAKLNDVSNRGNYIVIGDLNAIVGEDVHANWPEVMGKFGLGRL